MDLLYHQFERDLSKEIRSGNFLHSSTSIALTGVASLLNAPSTVAILTAIDTGLKGSKQSFDKEVLINQTLPVLLTKMDADRATVRTRILSGLALLVDSYPLEQGLTDLRDYERAGTFSSALSNLTGEAALQADVEKRAVQVIGFERSASYLLLKRCLFSNPEDPSTFRTDRAKKMDKWLRTKPLQTISHPEGEVFTVLKLIGSTDPLHRELQLGLVSEFCQK